MCGPLLFLLRLTSFIHRFVFLCCFTCILQMLSPSNQSLAAEPADSQAVQLVGLVPAPPFAMKDRDGDWEGIAVNLWRHVAQDLGLRFEFREMAIRDLIAGLEQGRLLAALTAVATADREAVMDFSHPYYSSGLAIAVPVRASSGNWFEPLGNVISFRTVKITSVLLGLLLIAAILVWLFERHANPEHFNPRPLRGITDGLWWAAVTLTTVGYGDKAPRTRAGRVIGVIWMFAAVVLIALFTAQVTSSLTVTSLTGRVRGPADLAHVKVGAIQDSPAQAVLRAKFGVSAAGYPGFRQGLEALDRGDIDAFVGAEPVLRYEIANNFPARLAVVGESFMRVDYVFAFPLGSDMRKQVNRVILSYIETDEWRDLLRQYLGGDK
jgi:polar amino acid transport system substrate-binding protein